jgi:NAD(P)-dependent dehydrogenase (short-subunit alcohol dehydrogenase family)
VSIGLTEAFTPEEFSRVYDVNVNGPVRVNRAVLPSMRARRSGLLVHLSSAAGRATVPALAPYCASKYALEALADAYRFELHPWGVQSVLVEPGIYRTPIFDDAVLPSDSARLASYGPHADYVERVRHGFAAAMADPDNEGPVEVAEAVVRLVEMDAAARPFRTVVSAPLESLLTPYNVLAESHRPIVAGIFGVQHLVAADVPSNV